MARAGTTLPQSNENMAESEETESGAEKRKKGEPKECGKCYYLIT